MAAHGPGKSQTLNCSRRARPFVLRDFFWAVKVPQRLPGVFPFADLLPLDQVGGDAVFGVPVDDARC